MYIPKANRVHFGAGKLAALRHMSVFINCPFDNDYRIIFDAVVFATVCCGFIPRSAIESGCTAVPRMDRITQAILSSKYSIHDLCRCRGEGEKNFSRFNMPLELGVSMAQRFGSEGSQSHDWLLLVPDDGEYARYVSDLAGFDPKRHDGSLLSIIPAVMSWLATRPDAIKTPTPRDVLSLLPVFQNEKNMRSDDWGGDLPWADVLLCAMEVAGISGDGSS